MRESVSGPGDERLVETFVEVAERDLAIINERQLDEGWDRLHKSTSPAGVRRRGPGFLRGRWLAFASVCAAAAAVAIIAHPFIFSEHPARLQYSVEGSVVGTANSITGAPSSGARLLFSDDSRIEFSALTKLNMDALDSDGAQVTLVDGAIEVYVKPRSHSTWTFAAGPFRVNVKGTTFSLAYSAREQRMRLHMTTGLVAVLGPQGREIAVSAGEDLDLSAEPAPTTAFGSDSAPEQASGEEEPAPSPTAKGNALVPAVRGQASREALRRRSVTRGRDDREPRAQVPTFSWSQLITQGRFAEVVADAEQRGLDTTLAQANAADLSSLADAARYTKRRDLARQVLLAMRSRFAGTEPARDASFFLGRLGESEPGQTRAALDWYETYLRESPRGLYAAEALGREMTLLAGKDRSLASKLAKQYLERFPRGPQAELARSLLEAASD